jgi:hypothetical protein
VLGEDCGDVPERPHLLISELFDEGLLALGYIPSLNHCREEILSKNHKLLPLGAKVYAQVCKFINFDEI